MENREGSQIMAFKDLLISFIIVSLFAFSLLAYAIGIANMNNTNASIINDPRVSVFNQSIGSQLESIDETGDEQRENFESENPSTSFGEIIFQSIVGVGKTLTSSVFGFVNLLATLVSSTIFGNNKVFAVVIGSVFAILTISIIFLLWRAYKTGE